jgi:hypothetical protein
MIVGALRAGGAQRSFVVEVVGAGAGSWVLGGAVVVGVVVVG